MYQKAQNLFYGLSIFLLLTALFVLQPSNTSEVSQFQANIQHQFSIAWQETIGDQPYFSDLELVYDSVNDFYSQAASASIALLGHGEGDQDLAQVFKAVYSDLAKATVGRFEQKPSDVVAAFAVADPNFMSEPAIYNIVPEASHELWIMNHGSGQVAGASVQSGNSVNSADKPWITIQDNFTGQLYCLAVYNGDVNKYLGACKSDYH